MKIEAINPETQTATHFDIPDDQAAKLEELTRDGVSDAKLSQYIDNLELSADAKALMHDITKSTIKVGKQIIAVGKRAVEILIAIARQFPKMSLGFILALLIGALISSIPVLGVIFGPTLTLILAVFGLAKGFAEDLRDQGLDRKIKEAVAMYDPLKSAV